MSVGAAAGRQWDPEAIADMLDEFGVSHSWIRLQLDLIAANRSLVTNVVVARLIAVQCTADELQDVAGQLAALDRAVLFTGLETWAERANCRDHAATRPVLQVHQGGRP
jgi:hypothetical protein